ncbi:molybdate ABC transporter permease subunit [Dehalococcoidia bacterium]|nr:molybdate ABC transporter permease subunit [Dehalococcoidia bacterium]
MATVMNIPVALAISWLVVKYRVRGRSIIEVIVSLPLAVPPVVTGYALLLILGREGPVGLILRKSLGVELVFTWVAATLAAALVSFPLLIRAVMTAMEGVDERMERSARTLGAGPLRVALTITLPLAYRGILAGVLLAFVRALSEFGATIVVAGNIPGRTQTLPLAIFESVQLGRDSDTFRFIAVSVSLAVVTLVVHNWLLSRQSDRR